MQCLYHLSADSLENCFPFHEFHSSINILALLSALHDNFSKKILRLRVSIEFSSSDQLHIVYKLVLPLFIIWFCLALHLHDSLKAHTEFL